MPEPKRKTAFIAVGEPVAMLVKPYITTLIATLLHILLIIGSTGDLALLK